MYIVQSVINQLKNINPQIRTYLLGMLLSRGRKNCAAMAYETGLSQKELYAFLSNGEANAQIMEKEVLLLAQRTRTPGKLRALIVDPSTIVKSYAKRIENLCHDRSGCTRRVERCLVPVYAAVADENGTIPLFVDFWVQEKIIGKKFYKSKIEITQEIILKCIDKNVFIDITLLDGVFSVQEMFTFFKEKNLKFSMRIPRNRIITTADGISAQLKKHPALKLHRNERCKTVQATIRGEIYFLTIEKRRTKQNDWEEVFIVSNIDLLAKEQVATYNLRWPMEKKIRTNKQKFGIGDCQALQEYKQKAHIMAGFLNYAILSSIKNDKKKQSIDEVVNIIRDSHFDDLINAFSKPFFPKHYSNNVLDAKSIQNYQLGLLASQHLIGHAVH